MFHTKNILNRMVCLSLLVSVGFAALLYGHSPASAATSPTLGAADSFAVLAGEAITNVPTSAITGDVGLSPAAGSNYAGLTAAEVTGTIYDVNGTGPAGSVMNPSLLTTAKTDLVTAYDALNAGANADANCIGGMLTSGTDLTTLSPLGPGLYCSAGSFLLTGNLNLTGSGVWVFKAVSTVITSPGSSVTGGDPCNVWWRVGSSATLDTTTSFIGNILALTSITLNNGATLNGRALARNAAVTMIHNTISLICAAPPPPAAAIIPTLNEWGVIIFMVLAGLGSVYYLRRQKARA